MTLTTYFTVAGKTALITGCNTGIGETMVVYHFEAAPVGVGLSTTLTKGSKVEDEVQQTGGDFFPYAFDVSEPSRVCSTLTIIKSIRPKNDLIINNAGVILRDSTGG